MWFFRSRCSVVAVPQTRWTLGLWCRLGGCWVPRFPRSEMKFTQDNRNKESCLQGWRWFLFERLKVISNLWIWWIVISHWIFFSCRSTSLCMLCTHLCWKMCICFYALCNLHVSYDAFYFIAGVWVGSVAAISMLAARSRQRRRPVIPNFTVWALIFWWIYNLFPWPSKMRCGILFLTRSWFSEKWVYLQYYLHFGVAGVLAVLPTPWDL